MSMTFEDVKKNLTEVKIANTVEEIAGVLPELNIWEPGVTKVEFTDVIDDGVTFTFFFTNPDTGNELIYTYTRPVMNPSTDKEAMNRNGSSFTWENLNKLLLGNTFKHNVRAAKYKVIKDYLNDLEAAFGKTIPAGSKEDMKIDTKTGAIANNYYPSFRANVKVSVSTRHQSADDIDC